MLSLWLLLSFLLFAAEGFSPPFPPFVPLDFSNKEVTVLFLQARESSGGSRMLMLTYGVVGSTPAFAASIQAVWSWFLPQPWPWVLPKDLHIHSGCFQWEGLQGTGALTAGRTSGKVLCLNSSSTRPSKRLNFLTFHFLFRKTRLIINILHCCCQGKKQHM